MQIIIRFTFINKYQRQTKDNKIMLNQHKIISQHIPIMLRWIFIIYFWVLLSHVNGHKTYKHTCQFGHLYGDKKIQTNPQDKPDQLLDDKYLYSNHRRHLQTLVRNTIRITLDTNDFNSVRATSNGQRQTTTTNLAFLKRTMLVVQNFYQTRLKVSTVSRVFAPSSCVDFNPSSNDVSNGISNSDLHIYVKYITDRTQSYGATGKSCKYITSRTLPDATFQQGRPTVGRIIFNTFNIIDGQTTLTNRLFASITATALHQTMHILGFDSTMYDTFLDSTNVTNIGNVYEVEIINSINLNSSRTGGNNSMLQTPQVTKWAQEFFNCSSLIGMALQNQDGSSSHWERLAMYDQLMTGTQLGPQKGFSGLTFALLKDMGWYEVDGSFNDTSNYGYHLQCNFFNNACYDTPINQKYFCTMATSTGVSTCAANFLGKATCTDQAGVMADGCGVVAPYFNCVDPAQSDDGYKAYTLQKYQTNSFCVKSTFANVGITNKYQGRCYPYKCLANSIEFYIDVYTVICRDTEAGVNKTLSALNGILQCPNFIQFCQQSRKICPNWCSQNGFCTRGICNCLPGFYGADCSITTCTMGQFYDSTTSRCVNGCPTGTYSNKYSRTCMVCNSNCQQCRDQPTICTGCLSTPTARRYFVVSSSTCQPVCPSTTYLDGDYCRDCSIANNCATCSYTANNCTSCLNGKFLQNPNFGICGNTCSGSYPNYDVVNYKCVSSCINNLIYYAGGCTRCPNPTDGNCDKCANGTYKYIGDQSCHPICPSTYYANVANSFCEKCDITCLECDGGYPQNCTSCLSSSNYKYLLLSRVCVASCPLGFYANSNTTTCQLCPPALNCATCSMYSNGTIYCLTCKNGFFLQTNKTCTSGCNNTHFKNTWNNSCDPCSSSCGRCTSAAASSCIDCPVGKVFLANITGSFCITMCPTLYYFQSGGNCLPCYSTCSTCNGTNSDQCLTCIDGLFLSQGMCRYVCPIKTYPQVQTGMCEQCDRKCTFCFGPTINNCTACFTGLVLNNFTCTNSCPDDLTVNQWGVCYQNNIYTFLSLILLFFLYFI